MIQAKSAAKRRHLLTLLSVLAAFALIGCQSLPFPFEKPRILEFPPIGANTDARIDYYLQRHEYDAALAQINRQPASKERQEQRDEIAHARQDYVNTTLTTGRSLLEAQEWSPLSQLMEEALDSLPNEPSLVSFDAERVLAESAFIDQNTARLHLDESFYLLQILPTTRLLATAFPDYAVHRASFDRLIARQKALSELLFNDSRNAIKRSEFDLAQAAFDRAIQLNPAADDGELSAALLAEKQRRAEGVSTLQAANRALVIDALDTQFASAMREGDLGAAQRIMARFNTLDAGNAVRQQQQALLDKTVDTVLAVGIKEGDEKYNAGDIEGALAIWNRIVALQPNHSGLLERIGRANRFLLRLDELQKALPSNGP